MSHSVTVTRTMTTTTNTSTVIVNTGYLKTLPGLLKFFQMILCAVCVGIIGWYYGYRTAGTPPLFYLMMFTTFLIGTTIILLSCVCTLSTGSIISKTIYEVLYHSVATILLLAASITLLVEVTERTQYREIHNAFMAASILGLITSVLYLMSAIVAGRSYRLP